MSTQISAQVFDRASVLDMVDGDLDFMHELIRMFLDDLPPSLERLRSAVSRGDTEIVQQTAHRMKSSVGNMGGHEVREVVIALEQAARSGDLSTAPDLLTVCEERITQLVAALESVLNES